MDSAGLVRMLVGREQQSGAEQFLKLVSDPFKGQFSENAFWSALGVSIGFTIVINLLFCILRPYNTVVYAPRLKHADEKHAPPQLSKGFFSWVKPVVKTREPYFVEKVGLDATVFLRFTRMCRNLFLTMSIIGCAVMIPVNVSSSNSYGTKLSAFVLMTPQNVFGQAIWAHVVCAWSFDIIIMIFLWWNYRAVTRLRRDYFESPEYQNSLHARTLLITDIPNASRTDDGIAQIVEQAKPTGALARCAVGRNVKELPELISQHEKAVRQLESYLAKYLKNPDRLPTQRPLCKPSKKDRSYTSSQRVDAIDYLTGRIRELEQEIKEVRETIDMRNPMPYGFASYETIPDAHTVAYASRKKHPKGTTIRLAPRPNELIWNNLPLSKSARKWKATMGILWVALLTLIWIAPNALIAVFLSNLSNLGLVWHDFQTQLNAHPRYWAAVQGIASPAITSLVYLVLPIIFRRLAMRAGDVSKTSREHHVIHRLYAFFVFNNLIVFSLFGCIWGFVTSVIELTRDEHKDLWTSIKASDLGVKLTITLCTVSQFWVTWLLQRNLGAAVDLAQVVNLVWSWFARHFMAPTPRQLIEWTAPPPFDYASYYNYFLFYATVALCFATLQPIVLPVTALYFSLDSWLKKYLLMYVFITKTESGGGYWRLVFNRMLFATLLANILVGLVVWAKGSSTMSFCVMPLPFVLGAFKIYCSRTFDDKIRYYTKGAGLKDPESSSLPTKPSRRNDKLGTRFGHPALFKPLIVPMVHAKAQRVLAQIYTGRLNSTGPDIGTEFNDVQLDQMSKSRPGKASHGSPGPAPFEMVPEHHLDFSYYKDRDDFGDEHGAGNIYSRPGTPRSYAAGGGGTPGSSRPSSPAPITYTSGGRPIPQRLDNIDHTYPPNYHQPGYRSESPYRSPPDSGVPITNPYTHPNDSDSHIGLLGAASLPATQRSAPPQPTGEPPEETSYEFFRGRR
ncbi:MAG: Transmembrane protein 63C [Geoglossum umbratile]|nr:MAG: Transmembrane protein 63C [Geoglossum umbratile]